MTKPARRRCARWWTGSSVPLVADIHFDYKLAIRSIENGIAKVRINPGNIGGVENVRKLADCVKAHHVPVRVGVNAGSLEKELLQKYGGPTAEALVESALNAGSDAGGHGRFGYRAFDEGILRLDDGESLPPRGFVVRLPAAPGRHRGGHARGWAR